MKLKVKIALLAGGLIVLLAILWSVSSVFVRTVSHDTEVILKDNYRSLEYAEQMRLALDSFTIKPGAVELFEKNLLAEERNITEPGEDTVALELRKNFELLRQNNTDALIVQKIRTDIHTIISQNMQAIEAKNSVAVASGSNALWRITIIGISLILLSVFLLIYIPGLITKPIRTFRTAIKEIAERNYAHRVPVNSGDEFGELASAFNTMAQKLNEYESSNYARVLWEKKRIDALINQMNDPIIGLDENKTILFANDAAITILGLNESLLIGHYAPDVAVSNDLLRTLVQGIIKSEKEDGALLKIFSKGRERYFSKNSIEVSIVPTGEEKEQFIGYVIILRDVTPFKELDVAKTNFIASISHELKTPLASSNIGLKLLENEKIGALTEQQKEILYDLKKDNTRMIKLVSELMDISQAETGRINLKSTTFPLNETVETAIDAVKNQAGEKNVSIVKQLLYKGTLTADKEKITWVLVNLLTNAIRYSPQNSRITVSTYEEKGKIKISVLDKGIGIDPHYHHKIFEKFFKVPGSPQSAESTGLGLSISKDFIEAMGGHITLESTPNQGSTFSLVF